MSMPRSLIFLTLLVFITVQSVPPEVCFANFRWDDCGRPPKDVFYYWKPGSRCEIGTWRGCLPNVNMFKDEYECVETCIFTVRARSGDYHLSNDIYDEHLSDYPNDSEEELTTKPTDDEVTTAESTTSEADNTTEISTNHDNGADADISTKADITGESTDAQDHASVTATEKEDAEENAKLKLTMSDVSSTDVIEKQENLNSKPGDTDDEKITQENIQTSVQNGEATEATTKKLD